MHSTASGSKLSGEGLDFVLFWSFSSPEAPAGNGETHEPPWWSTAGLEFPSRTIGVASLLHVAGSKRKFL